MHTKIHKRMYTSTRRYVQFLSTKSTFKVLLSLGQWEKTLAEGTMYGGKRDLKQPGQKARGVVVQFLTT